MKNRVIVFVFEYRYALCEMRVVGVLGVVVFAVRTTTHIRYHTAADGIMCIYIL